MNTHYLTGTEFELLVRSQSKDVVFLPTDGVLETDDDNNVIISIHNLVKSKMLTVSNENSGFDLSNEARKIVNGILDAKIVLQVKTYADENAVLYYISPKSTLFVQVAENRSDSYRLGTVDDENIGELIFEQGNLPDIEPSGYDYDDDYITSISEDNNVELEKKIVSAWISEDNDSLFENDDIVCSVNFFSVKKKKNIAGLVIHRTAISEKMTVITSKESYYTEPYGKIKFLNTINLLMEAII